MKKSSENESSGILTPNSESSENESAEFSSDSGIDKESEDESEVA